MYKKILLPTDGSDYAAEEIKRATDLISEDGEIIVLSVAGKLTSTAFQKRSSVRKVNKGMYEEAEDNVKQMLNLFDDSANVRGIVEVGFASEKIIEVSENENCDLIIISSSGKSGLHRFILGSVTEKVLKNSERDGLLIHNK